MQVAAIFCPEPLASVPLCSCYTQSGRSKSYRKLAAGLWRAVCSSRLLCRGLQSGWRSRELPYQKGETGLNLSISGLCRKVFCFGGFDMVPEFLYIVFKSCPNISTQGNSSRTNWYNFLIFQCLSIFFWTDTHTTKDLSEKKNKPFNK